MLLTAIADEPLGVCADCVAEVQLMVSTCAPCERLWLLSPGTLGTLLDGTEDIMREYRVPIVCGMDTGRRAASRRMAIHRLHMLWFYTTAFSTPRCREIP